MVKSVMITEEGKVHELSQEEEAAATRGRWYAEHSLQVPERWRFKKFRLTITMLDQFQPEDEPNPLATMLFRKLRAEHYTPDDIIFGKVFLANETDDELIDFTKEDFAYIFTRAIFNN